MIKYKKLTLLVTACILLLGCNNGNKTTQIVDNNITKQVDNNNSTKHHENNNTVEKHDSVKPLIQLNGLKNIILKKGARYSDAGATATDDKDGNLTSKIKVTGLSSIDTNIIKSYTIHYVVSDAAGNEANTSRVVIINAPPVVTIAYKKFTTAIKYPNKILSEVVDSDNNNLSYKWKDEKTNMILATTKILSHAFTKEGNYTLTLNVKDEVNDVVSKSLDVVVLEKQKRVILPLVLKTNQTTSYKNFDDGELQTGATKNYTRDDAKKIVIDSKTNLMWQDDNNAKNNIKEWNDALKYCEDLTLGGYHDWKLPSRPSFVSLVDYEKVNPSIDNIFKNTANERYWTSNIFSPNGAHVCYVNFSSGVIHGLDQSEKHHVRCVRYTSSHQNITENFTRENNTTIDNVTNLQWQDDQIIEKKWEDALSYCNMLSLEAKQDWRLPNINEARSLIDGTINTPAVNHNYFKKFGMADNRAFYWTSTTLNNDTTKAWGLFFRFGGQDIKAKSELHYVRCVRNK